ncbi:MAG: peptide deformylase [Gammaproteobacteria bacterium]|nr:peptide deformylase [Gammaproteobacteria bacterium]
MTKLTILEFPDPRLRTVAKPVETIDAALRQMIDRMFDTMYEGPDGRAGIGLAATQVDFHKRLIVIDVSADRTEPYVLINPEIVGREGQVISEEGCLSVPDVYAKIERAEQVTVKALDRDGEPYELEADGLLARCIQHEMDHLEGKLFVDYLSDLKRQRVRKMLQKARRQREQEAGHAPQF